ncbi:alpha/beta-hydrolase [Agrocybe pediades]|nr:alpha/beta-hydrolase [Agrocybe pediades]
MTESSPTLATAPVECCLNRGFKHEGTSVGKVVTVAGVKTYVSMPNGCDNQEQKRIILFFSDVFGPFSNNAKLLQDYYASEGFIVLGVDYFLGDPIDAHLGQKNEAADAWFDAWLTMAVRRAAMCTPPWIEAVQDLYGHEVKYCAVGYCFGAPFVMDFAAKDDVAAAAFAHPGNLNESHFEKLRAPLLLSCAENDNTFSAESRRRAEDIMVKNKASYHIQVFSGVEHGFAARGDPTNENIRWAKEESARSIIGWFKRFT